MKFLMEIRGSKEHGGAPEREVRLDIRADELEAAYLHLAHPAERNGTSYYIRRHVGSGYSPGPDDPNCPVRDPNEPGKLTIPEHIEAMAAQLPRTLGPLEARGSSFGVQRVMLAVTISDLVSNLLRPSYHQNGLGPRRTFYFDAEPITKKTYSCLCYFEGSNDHHSLEILEVRFDTSRDTVVDKAGRDLSERGLVWAASIVPLVRDRRALSAAEISGNLYDLRQLFGRDETSTIQRAYRSFPEWDTELREILKERETARQARGEDRLVPLYTEWYHSILAMDSRGNLSITQLETDLPSAATKLASGDIVDAGILDSGGSCAIYDVWMQTYLNHSWYFREPRGAILLFQLTQSQKVPVLSGSWTSLENRC